MIINALTGEDDEIDWGRVFESGLNEGLENAVFSLPGEIAGVYGALENKYRAGYNEGEATVLKYKPTNGKDIVSTPDKTTTVLGRFGQDTSNIIDELNLEKNTNFSGDKGWFNLLNTPDEYHKVLGPELYWDEFNKPFLDAAIERGDIIVMVTPLDDISLYKDNGELTGYGHEYYYLMEKGYVYDNGRMIPVNEVK